MFKVILTAVALACATVLTPVTTASATPAVVPAAVVPAVLGAASDTAAGSCWEIKQQQPSATDGAYWLVTPQMDAPQQFYCDMTTDGGGWVLVGKGRNGWTKNVNALGKSSDLLSPGLSPMSAATSQYSATTIDQLLDNGRVDALADGVRLRRAMDVDGTSWQEARMRFSRFGHWAWAFGALYPLSNWSFSSPVVSGATGSGSTSQNFGSDSAYNRVTVIPGRGNGWSNSFAYGSQVRGTSSSTSYLWSADGGGGAVPFTDVYLRPHVTSDDAGFSTIPDAGTSKHTQPSVAESDALTAPWGVSGLAGNHSVEGSVEVQAFTQSGDNMYVGGNFKYVQQTASGAGQVQQSFLAAFNIHTGQWVSSFRPVLNEQVKALATLPNGDVVAGGQFTQANGQPATEIVALNPTTGGTDPGWSLTVENRKTAGVVDIRALDVFDGDLYLGGNFTHLTGGGATVYSSNIGRVAASNAEPSANWSGNLLNGGVNSISGGAAPGGSSRMYAAGFFTQSGTTSARRAVAFQTSAGAPLATPAWNPTWSNGNDYQRAIDVAGNKIWVGGSEHNLFQFDPVSFERTFGDIMYNKGDIQAISSDNGVVYAGCHCNYFDYANAYHWPNLDSDWTRADGMNWFGAWDNASGDRLPSFAPKMTARSGSGIWAIKSDSDGTVWAGGDITNAATATSRGAWAGGFARFPLADSTAPSTPGNLHVVASTPTTVTLGWNNVSDPSGVTYQVLRDDRPVASTSTTSITVPTSTAGRFFVRAADDAGNVSASTKVLTAANVDGAVLIPDDATWSYRYAAGPPPADWNQRAFDASSWANGAAPLGFGEPSVQTDLDHFAKTSDRPLAAYFTRQFQISDTSQVTKLMLNTLADDGVVLYVNGTEVGRSNMPDGDITYRNYAKSAVRTSAAPDVSITVPKNLLVNGTNVVSAETHLNYRATRDMSFHLAATAITGGSSRPPVAAFTASMNELIGSFDATGSTDPDGDIASYTWDFGDGATGTGETTQHTYTKAGTYPVILSVMDGDGSVTTLSKSVDATSPDAVVIADGAKWSYRYKNGAPPAGWNQPGFNASSWSTGSAVLGFGNASVKTDIDTFAKPTARPLAAYFVRSFPVSDVSRVTKLTLDTVADDGVVVYVNGVEVSRSNMPSGSISYRSYASSAIRTSKAHHLTIQVPANLLTNGTNVVSAETHLNYHKSHDLTFELAATLTTGP